MSAISFAPDTDRCYNESINAKNHEKLQNRKCVQMTKGLETKRQLVMLTYQMLCRQDASTITVRDIAREKGCSAPAIYKYFESLDYLIVVASVQFLQEYMEKYARLLDSGKPFLDIYMEGWELFNHYAFQRPDIFYRLFWGNENQSFGDAFVDHFELFPLEGSKEYLAYYYALMFNDNMRERDFLVLRRASNYQLMSEADARYFSVTNPLIVKGLLLEAMSQTPEKRIETGKLCNALLRRNMKHVLPMEV